MSGEDLYQRYLEANAAEGCDVDVWDDLSDMDQRVWERLAENLPDMPSAG